MKNKKSTDIAIIVILISILICIPAGSIGVFSQENDIDIQSTVSNPNIVKTQLKIPTSTTINIQDENQFLKSTSTEHSENIAIASTTRDESYPSMGINHNNILVAYEKEDIDGSHVCFRSSTDYGQHWPSIYVLDVDLEQSQNIETKSPSICVKPDNNKAYGTFISPYNDSGVLGLLDIPSISNANAMEGFALDWSEYGFWNFSSPDIVYYDDNDTKFDGVPYVVGVIGSTTYENETTGEGPCNDSIMFCYQDDSDSNIIWLVWDPTIQNCSHLSLSMDNPSNTLYGVCEIDNGIDKDILFFNDNPVHWSEGEEEFQSLIHQIFTGPQNLTNPNIFVKNNQIYAVMETDEYGDQEIIMYNSSDDGATWTKNRITSTTADSTNPTIFVNETHIQCSYIDSGNLSITSSIDIGVTWNAPVQINDQDGVVVSGYHTSDMADMDHLVWTDNRSGNNDIYTIVLNPPTVDLTVYDVSLKKGFDFLGTKNWVSFTVKNDGTGIASNIHVTFSYECNGQEPKSVPYHVDLSSIDANCNETKEQSLFRVQIPDYFFAMVQLFGIENITVHVDPKGTTGDANPSNNNATINVSYEDIFPEISQRSGLMSLIEFVAGFGIF